MPWDCFCPKCKACVVGGMTDDPDEIIEEMSEYLGKIMECESCQTKFSFDTLEVIREEAVGELSEHDKLSPLLWR